MDTITVVIVVVIALSLIVIIGIVGIHRHKDRHESPDDHHDSDGYSYDARYPQTPSEQERFGIYGEVLVFDMLQDIAKRCGGYAYHNVSFKGDDDGYSTEIDAILICQGGFFIIEVKSNKGVIYGNADDEKWYAEKEAWQEDKHPKNPVKQNQGHINHLRRLAGKGFPYLTSLVIFPCAKSIESVRSQVVHDFRSAKAFIEERIAEGKYKKATVDRFNEQWKSFCLRYGVSIQAHKENQSRYS